MIEQTLSALNAIDPSAAMERERIYEAERERLETAISTGHSRAQEIRDKIRDVQKGEGADGEAAAEALLRGEVIEAVAVDRLREELDTVNLGLRTLNQRLNHLMQDRRMKSDPIEGEISAAVAPLTEMLKSEAEAAVKILAQIYADADALSSLAPQSGAASLREGLNDVMLVASTSRLGTLKDVDVTADIRSLADAPCLTYLKRKVPKIARSFHHRVDLDFVHAVAGFKRAD